MFIDADYSDHPDELPRLVAPILDGEAEFVLGSRMRARQPRGAMLPQAIFGNRRRYERVQRLTRSRTLTALGPRLPGPLRAWSVARDLPPTPSQTFREWWEARERGA